MLVAHVLVPPALSALLSCPDAGIQALLAPGHVCVVTGYRDYDELARRFRVPIVVTGFEPLDILRGVLRRRAPARERPGAAWRTSTRGPCCPRATARRSG